MKADFLQRAEAAMERGDLERVKLELREILHLDRQDERANELAVLFKVGEIGRNNVNTKKFRVREHHPRIHHDDVITVADRHRIHPELTESAEWDDLQLTVGHKLHRTWYCLWRAGMVRKYLRMRFLSYCLTK